MQSLCRDGKIMLNSPRHQQNVLTGSLREFCLLFLPILLMTFSTCIFLLVEKILLAQLSAKDMEAAVNAAYTIMLFQNPCIMLAMMAQVYVGRWRGAQELNAIGPGVWQFFWFSILSSLITIPIGIIYGNIYFKGTAIEEVVMPYYYFLISINFLYPLGTALSCFYIGQGKTRLVVCATLISQIVKLFIAYVLILGINDVLPPLGIMGGAWSTLIAQGGFCLGLLSVFLNSKHANLFNTRDWKFRPRLFWECIQPGLLRAMNRILGVSCWSSIAYLMSSKGGDYLLNFSIGGTLFLFLPFLGEAICQAQTTVVSQMLGAKQYQLLDKAFRTGTIVVVIAISLVGIPLVLFPEITFSYLFSKISMSESQISRAFFGVWISFIFFTFSYLPISYILAFKDTKFSLFMGFVNWINGYLFMYYAINFVRIEPDNFWLTLSFMHATTALLYYWRMNKLKENLKNKTEITISQPTQNLIVGKLH